VPWTETLRPRAVKSDGRAAPEGAREGYDSFTPRRAMADGIVARPIARLLPPLILAARQRGAAAMGHAHLIVIVAFALSGIGLAVIGFAGLEAVLFRSKSPAPRRRPDDGGTR
jgi:hypothetical protein